MTPTGWGPLVAACVVLAAATEASSDGDDRSDGDDAAEDAASTPEIRVVTLDGADTSGPPELDRVTVLQHGSEDAENVLVLAPGTSAGAAYFSPLALDLVDALPGWQVWAVDRRENLLEDHSQRTRFIAGEADPQEATTWRCRSTHWRPSSAPGAC